MVLETTATEDERNTGADIADRLIYCHCHPELVEGSPVIPDLIGNLQPSLNLPIHPIHPIQAILQNPEVAALIDDLGLEIKSITYIKPRENESID